MTTTTVHDFATPPRFSLFGPSLSHSPSRIVLQNDRTPIFPPLIYGEHHDIILSTLHSILYSEQQPSTYDNFTTSHKNKNTCCFSDDPERGRESEGEESDNERYSSGPFSPLMDWTGEGKGDRELCFKEIEKDISSSSSPQLWHNRSQNVNTLHNKNITNHNNNPTPTNAQRARTYAEAIGHESNKFIPTNQQRVVPSYTSAFAQFDKSTHYTRTTQQTPIPAFVRFMHPANKQLNAPTTNVTSSPQSQPQPQTRSLPITKDTKIPLHNSSSGITKRPAIAPAIPSQQLPILLSKTLKEDKPVTLKRRRTTREQTRILENAFKQDPLPTKKFKESLAQQLSLSPMRVQVWFQNRRAKQKRMASEIQFAVKTHK